MNLAVWETDFTIAADVSGGAFRAFRANMQATPKFFNWICDYLAGAWDAAFYPTPSSTGAKAWGEGRFYGVFPLPFANDVLWHGVGHHEHQLTLTSWQLWETGTVDAFGQEPNNLFPHWFNWKTVTTHAGDTQTYDVSVIDPFYLLPR